MMIYHKSLLNAKVIMDDFGQGSQAVGGAGGITVNRKRDTLLTSRLKPESVQSNDENENCTV